MFFAVRSRRIIAVRCRRRWRSWKVLAAGNGHFLIVKLEAGLQFLSRFSLRETIQTIAEAY